jgi:tetratricopeptide (TPR) repeat protein
MTTQETLNQAISHHQAGRFAEAEELYRQVLASEPNNPNALNMLGALAGEYGRLEEAMDLIGRAVARHPRVAEFRCNLGETYRRAGRTSEAQTELREAIRLNPTLADAHNGLGLVLQSENKTDDAIAAFSQAILWNPALVDAHFNLGTSLIKKKEYTQAIAALKRAIELDPRHAKAHNDLGACYVWTKQLDLAMEECRRAIEINPEQVEAHNNLGACLKSVGRLDEAIESGQRALAIRPDFVDALNNLGMALEERGRFTEAVAAYKRALVLQPDLQEAHWNLALESLRLGDLETGWREYEWRLKGPEPLIAPDFQQPRWTGRDLHGKTILLHPEQGFGDMIHFIRYIPLLAEKGARIIFCVQAPLVRLFTDFPQVEKIVPVGEPLPNFDYYCPLMSLPLMFGTTLENIPNQVPYLHPSPGLVREWTEKLGPKDSRLRVGLVWAGSPGHKSDPVRSLRLEQFAPLAAIDGVEFHSLQKGPAAEQAKNPPIGMKLIDRTDQLADFADTAALIANLDLVISVDTAVAHLAGAMAKPVWVALHISPDWRWMFDRPDSPWYPTMRLFRQSKANEWSDVAAKLAEALGELQ